MDDNSTISLDDLKRFRELFAQYGPILAVFEGLGNKNIVEKRLTDISEVLAQLDEDIKSYPMSIKNAVSRDYKQMFQDLRDSRERIEGMRNLIT